VRTAEDLARWVTRRRHGRSPSGRFPPTPRIRDCFGHGW
jgi:hypothetical protein